MALFSQARAAAPFPAGSREPSSRWAILALLCVAQLMIVLDVTIVNIALPSAQHDLHFSTADRQWVVTAYALTFGSLLLFGGKLGDLFGRKRTFVAGLLGFAGASALGGLAPSFGVLVAARALQGLFGALLAPSALSLLTITFAGSPDRPQAFALFGAIGASGASVGLLLGGLLTQVLTWRFCMYVNLAFAIPAALAGLRVLDGARAHGPRQRLDFAGLGLASSGAFCLVYGFSNAELHASSAQLTIALFVASAVLLASFVAVERRIERPLLPLRIVADRSRGGAYASMLVVNAALFSVFLFMTFYMQQTLRFSPVLTGVGFLPLTCAALMVAPLVQTRILPRVGARSMIATGMILGIIAMIVFSRLTPSGSYAIEVLPGMVLIGAAAACVASTAFATGTLGVQGEDTGVASAMVNTAQQLGGSVGISLLSTIFASAMSGYLSNQGGISASSAGAAVHGYNVGFTAAAVIFGVGLLVALVVLPSRRALQAGCRVSVPSANQPAAFALHDLTRTGSHNRRDAA